jgi:hypothetical protein
MKFSISLALLGVFALAACEIDEPPPRNVKRMPAARYPQQTAANEYPPQPQPFQSPATAPVDAPPTQTTTTTDVAAATTEAPSQAGSAGGRKGRLSLRRPSAREAGIRSQPVFAR